MSFPTPPMRSNDIADFTTPGVQVQLDPDQIEALGFTEEDALSEADAWESQQDIPPSFYRTSDNVVPLRAG